MRIHVVVDSAACRVAPASEALPLVCDINSPTRRKAVFDWLSQHKTLVGAYDRACKGEPCSILVEACGDDAVEIHGWPWELLRVALGKGGQPVLEHKFDLVRRWRGDAAMHPVAPRVLLLVGDLEQREGIRSAEPTVLAALKDLPDGSSTVLAAPSNFIEQCKLCGALQRFPIIVNYTERPLDCLPRADVICYVGHGHGGLRLPGHGEFDAARSSELFAKLGARVALLFACSLGARFVHPVLTAVDHVMSCPEDILARTASTALGATLQELHDTNSMPRIRSRMRSVFGSENVQFWTRRDDDAFYPARIEVDGVTYKLVAPHESATYYIGEQPIGRGAASALISKVASVRTLAGLRAAVPTPTEWRTAYNRHAFVPSGTREVCSADGDRLEYVWIAADRTGTYANLDAGESALRVVLREHNA